MSSTSPGEDLRRLAVSVATGDALDVRHFHVKERMNDLFEATIVAVSESPDLDFEAIAGGAASFTVRKDLGPLGERTWTGICRHIEQIGVEERGLSTYRLVLVSGLWLLGQRRNHRMFQQRSEIDIARALLAEWGVAVEEQLSGTYGKRDYRVQYGESDLTFLKRILEEAGVSFHHRTSGGEMTLLLADAPHRAAPRPPIAFRDNPTDAAREHVTRLHTGRRVRPGKYTVRDHDHRRAPSYPLGSSAEEGAGVEASLERYHYIPGAFLFESPRGEPAPVGDDRGRYRTDEREAAALARRRLEAKRASSRTISFETNTIDLAPGAVVSFLDHPRSELSAGEAFLVTSFDLRGEPNGKWTCACEAVSAGVPFRPPLVTPRPRVGGVESATVVGPQGEEIATDELGRVRVHFHWDRESRMNEASSCWIHVSQPWGGSGFGGTNLPRVGQEVIVDFLGGDPDRPIIVGRVYTALQTTPYKLPDNKTQSGWKSRSSPGGGPESYNEIMFEDRKGRELLRMQAERDLDKLVKNDESVQIGHDRAKRVGHDDSLEVGHDRARKVGHDETVSIGHDRTRVVEHDETVSVGNDRTRVVGNNESITVGASRAASVALNESLFVGQSQSESISADRSVQVGQSHTEKIGRDMTVTVGGSASETVGKVKTETVALASTETVGAAKALSVGAAYTVTVGGVMNTAVSLAQIETVGRQKTVTVGDHVTITCGASTFTMSKDGRISISGRDISIEAQGTVNVHANGEVNVESAANVNVKGANIHMN